MVAELYALSASLYDGDDVDKRADAMARVAADIAALSLPAWKAPGGGEGGSYPKDMWLGSEQTAEGGEGLQAASGPEGTNWQGGLPMARGRMRRMGP